MALWLAWALLGALFGVGAAQHKGFSVAGGVLGGLLLGPLALLMFFVSGVAPGDEKKQCPHCAEFVKADAKVCKHCGRDIGSPPAARPSGVRPPAVRPSGPRPGSRTGTRPAAR